MVRPLIVLLVCVAMAPPAAAQQLPAAPAPVPVSLNGAHTALLVLDVIESIGAARRGGAYVIHSAAGGRSMLAPTTQPAFLAAVAPHDGEAVVLGGAYTVVVADDATSAALDYAIAVEHYQLLTQLSANPKNEPLLQGAVTISRSDLMTFR